MSKAYLAPGLVVTVTTLRDTRRSDDIVYVAMIDFGFEKLFLKSDMRVMHKSRWTKDIKKASQFVHPAGVCQILETAGLKPIIEQ